MDSKLTIYTQIAGGRWEARYWHTDEDRYFRFTSHDKPQAIRNAAKHSGYKIDQCKIVTH